MGFSGIGIWEVLVIIVVILLVLGPNRLPEAARKLGQAVRALRKASAEITATITREIDAEDNKPKHPKPSSTNTTPKAKPEPPEKPEAPAKK